MKKNTQRQKKNFHNTFIKKTYKKKRVGGVSLKHPTINKSSRTKKSSADSSPISNDTISLKIMGSPSPTGAAEASDEMQKAADASRFGFGLPEPRKRKVFYRNAPVIRPDEIIKREMSEEEYYFNPYTYNRDFLPPKKMSSQNVIDTRPIKTAKNHFLQSCNKDLSNLKPFDNITNTIDYIYLKQNKNGIVIDNALDNTNIIEVENYYKKFYNSVLNNNNNNNEYIEIIKPVLDSIENGIEIMKDYITKDTLNNTIQSNDSTEKKISIYTYVRTIYLKNMIFNLSNLRYMILIISEILYHLLNISVTNIIFNNNKKIYNDDSFKKYMVLLMDKLKIYLMFIYIDEPIEYTIMIKEIKDETKKIKKEKEKIKNRGSHLRTIVANNINSHHLFNRNEIIDDKIINNYYKIFGINPYQTRDKNIKINLLNKENFENAIENIELIINTDIRNRIEKINNFVNFIIKIDNSRREFFNPNDSTMGLFIKSVKNRTRKIVSGIQNSVSTLKRNMMGKPRILINININPILNKWIEIIEKIQELTINQQ